MDKLLLHDATIPGYYWIKYPWSKRLLIVQLISSKPELDENSEMDTMGSEESSRIRLCANNPVWGPIPEPEDG